MSDILVDLDGPPADGEPFYIRQHGGFAALSPDERREWFQAAYAEAKEQGATWGRMSVDDTNNPSIALVEAWKVQPREDGPIRWQLTYADA